CTLGADYGLPPLLDYW
nr:immunoglobulin heavy chain junction region [Macaca mulatta]MOW77091.1 immunoglobulin heavy chain junction region [Macaca mulatta]MOW77844.1 immunoglobulin heavy chain junction region [Macaca mulatta]MOW79441.1 immunoglobulin heavy chain junction region [Macaca mulatta]MOW80029.1 immunoglobulin heavy chain junction region [Macaca mulatta]